MTATGDAQLLDREEIRRLFDLRSSFMAHSGGGYTDDPYPQWHALREQAPVHEGVVHDLTDYPGDWFFQGLPYPDRPHFSAFSFEACDAAFRDGELFASHAAEESIDTCEPGVFNSILAMGGTQHRRYRALVQPSFVPAKAQWWINNWIEQTVHALIDQFVDDGHAELNVDFAAAIPVLTITGSFGVDVEQALIIREFLMSDTPRVFGILEPIIAARREQPADDLISVLVEAEYTDEDGVDPPTHRRRDPVVRDAADGGGIRDHVEADGDHARGHPRAPRRARRGAGRPRRGAAGDRGVGALDADRPDVLAPRHRATPTSSACTCPRVRCSTCASARPTATRRAGTGADEYDITRAAEAVARVRQRTARVPRHARRARRDERGHHRAARPPAEPAARSRRRATRSYIGFYERGATAIPVVFD